jgi:uncharacterized membrane protein YtjA (UPF0391 family)
LVVALVAAVFGFTGVAAGAATLARAVFAAAMIVAVMGAILAVARRNPPQ